MRRSAAKLLVIAAFTVLAACSAALARGEEHFGNDPVHENNYADWPGLMPTLNHPSRVYRVWVNGNELFYYRGDTAALNDTLAKFTLTGIPVKEVVLRPGPGEAQTFDQTRKVPFRWSLHLLGGLSRQLTILEKGDRVWPKHPVLTVYVDRDLDLANLRIPEGLTVTSLADVKARTREGLKSGDKTVRGWSNGVLTDLDPFDEVSRDAVAAMLKDPDNWVRLNAAGALAQFGKKAQATLPQLREAQATADPELGNGLMRRLRRSNKPRTSPPPKRSTGARRSGSTSF